MTLPISLSNSIDTPEQLAQVERRARRFWVSLIVGFLSIQVLIGFGSIYLALGDPSVAIIPNYHQSALDWDIKHRAQQLLDELGWQVNAAVTPVEAEHRTIGIRVAGKSGRPVEQLHIESKVFHHARGQEIYASTLTEIEPGLYTMPVALTRPGLWQIDLAIEGNHGIARKTIEIEVE